MRSKHHKRKSLRPAHLMEMPVFPPLLMGNWKMQHTPRSAARAVRGIVRDAGDLGSVATLVVFPSYAALPQTAHALADTDIAVGAQDAFWEDAGSYTGEVSVPDLKELGVQYVLVGHSERRTYLGETDDMVNRKMLAVVRHGLTPVLCVGEQMDDRRAHRQDMLVTRQVQAAFRNVRAPFRGMQFIIAYEPLWAVGTGEACAPAEAARMAEIIQYALLELYDERIVRDTMRIAYGGSVTALNIRSYIAEPPISGALVGGASLDPSSFLAMAAAIAPRSPERPRTERKKAAHPKQRQSQRRRSRTR